MLPLEQGDEFPEFFARMAGEIARGEAPELFRKRIEYALDNSYARQVDRVEAMVNGTGA